MPTREDLWEVLHEVRVRLERLNATHFDTASENGQFHAWLRETLREVLLRENEPCE